MSEFLDKCRKYGEERLELAEKMKSPDDWKNLWTKSANEYLFKLGPCWTHMVEYYVSDFEIEIGFMIDVMGFDMFVVDKKEGCCIVTNPEKHFYCCFYNASSVDKKPTPPDAMKLSLMIEDITSVTEKLKSRGITFETEPEPYGGEGSFLYKGNLRTPNGIVIEFWGLAEEK